MQVPLPPQFGRDREDEWLSPAQRERLAEREQQRQLAADRAWEREQEAKREADRREKKRRDEFGSRFFEHVRRDWPGELREQAKIPLATRLWEVESFALVEKEKDLCRLLEQQLTTELAGQREAVRTLCKNALWWAAKKYALPILGDSRISRLLSGVSIEFSVADMSGVPGVVTGRELVRRSWSEKHAKLQAQQGALSVCFRQRPAPPPTHIVPALFGPVTQSSGGGIVSPTFPFLRQFQNVSNKAGVHASAALDPIRQETIIHVVTPHFGEFYLCLPELLTPDEIANLFLLAIRPVLDVLLKGVDWITVPDGQCQTCNLKAILGRRVLVRSATADLKPLEQSLKSTVDAEPIAPTNTVILSGLPSSQVALDRVFSAAKDDDKPSWATWSGVQSAWIEVVRRRGFQVGLDARAADSSAQDVLDALGTQRNVIVLSAHADETSISFPEPPPRGSKIGAADLAAMESTLRRNRPFVVLFCCRTGDARNLANFAQLLLRYGARGVAAPQSDIESPATRRMFEELLYQSQHRQLSPLEALREAEHKTGYREMDVWMGASAS